MWHPWCALCKDRVRHVSVQDRYDLMQFVYRALCHGRVQELRLTYEEAEYMMQAALPECAFEEDKIKLEARSLVTTRSPTNRNLPEIQRINKRMITLED